MPRINCRDFVETRPIESDPGVQQIFSLVSRRRFPRAPARKRIKPWNIDVSGRSESRPIPEFSFQIPTILIPPPFWFQISWMRKRDLHILTSSIYTYTGDERFSVKHPEASDEWTLKIDYVQQRDAGVYECQVNTEPKMNLAFVLTVEGKPPIISPGYPYPR